MATATNPLTVVDLGRKIKTKFPGQYDDIEDADLGRRVRAKHPEYSDFTDIEPQQKKNELEQPPAPRGFWSSLGDAINPIPAITEFFNRSGQIGSGMDALHVLNQIHSEAAKDPANAGVPMSRWKLRQPTASEQKIIDQGMQAKLPGAEGNAAAELSGPAVTAAGQAKEGNLTGAAGTLTGGYAVPPLALRYGPTIVKNVAQTVPGLPGLASDAASAGYAGAKVGLPTFVQKIPWIGPLVGDTASAVKTAAKEKFTQRRTTRTAAAHRDENPARAIEPPPSSTPEDLSPIPGTLPSGRKPGPVNQSLEPSPASPASKVEVRPSEIKFLKDAKGQILRDSTGAPRLVYEPTNPTSLPAPPPASAADSTRLADPAYELQTGTTPGGTTPTIRPAGAIKEHYQDAARTVWARAMGRWMDIGKTSYEDALNMTEDQWTAEARKAGLAKASPDKIKMALQELKLKSKIGLEPPPKP